MSNFIVERLDQLGRRHPRLMLAFTTIMAIITTFILVARPEGQTILYKAF
jgi:hypothetical protein